MPVLTEGQFSFRADKSPLRVRDVFFKLFFSDACIDYDHRASFLSNALFFSAPASCSERQLWRGDIRHTTSCRHT